MAQEMALQDQKPAFLQQVAAMADEFEGGMQGGLSLPVLSIRGKEFRFRYQGQEQSTRQRELDCIMVAARPAVSKRFFKDAYTQGSVEAPTCASTDGIAPDSGTELQSDKCATCPHNQWGSRVSANGNLGKACSDYKRLIVLPMMNGQLLDNPCVLDVPATSLRTPKGYQGHDLFLREYLTLLSRNQVPPVGAVTTLGFTDAEYPQVCFQFSRFVDEAEYNKANGFRETDDVEEALGSGGHEKPGQVQQAQPAQSSQPAQPEQQVVPEPTPAPEPTPEPQPAPEPAPTPEPTTEPAAEAQPAEQATDAEAEEGSDDVMNSVNALLKGLE